MASNNDLTNSENILVKVDQNNLMYIDPNSVVDNDGNIQPRGVKQENLVMYANLEADIIPRTTLVAKEQGSTLVSIAKGELNFLKNQTGDGNFDTSWTDSFVGKDNFTDKDGKPLPKTAKNYSGADSVNYDPSGQSFGIDSINITVKGANYTPQVTINFIDVRGKTLFESSENSPYRAFFHLPWPIFYLTVKGYYGKAIRYRLHMTKFSSKFNESNGNFEVTTTFVGSTYAFMNDIPLSTMINSPYMFLTENVENKKFNEKDGRYEKTISRSSRGYQILRSVYEQYEQKGLVAKGTFIKNDGKPVKTLKDLGYIAESLDKILERKIFNEVVDMSVFQGIKELETTLNTFESAISAWSKQNLAVKEFEVRLIGTDEYNWYYIGTKEKKSLDKITGESEGTLERLLKVYSEELNKSVLFENKLMNRTKSDFKKISLSTIKNIKSYYDVLTDGFVLVGVDLLLKDIFEIRKSFEEQRKKLEDEVEQKMNEIIKDPTLGFGFEPTIRNIFAVVLAGADVYIRLMKDTHNKAFDASKSRIKLLEGLSDEQKGKGVAIYPWPEVKKPMSSGKQNVIAYPGEAELVNKLKSNNKTLWPEVDFVEEYIKIVTNKLDTGVKTEPTISDINYIFESDSESNNLDDISGIDVINDGLPYTDKVFSSFIYEVYERAKYITLFDSYTNSMLDILAKEEVENIKESIGEDIELVDLCQKLTSIDSFITVSPDGTKFDGYLPSSSPHDRFTYLRDHLPTVPYIKDILEYPFKFEKYGSVNRQRKDFKSKEMNDELVKYVSEPYRTKIYPFNSDTYLDYLNKTEFTDDNFKFNGILQVNPSQGFVCSPFNVTSWVKPGYDENMFTQKLKNGNTSVNILNTPYFHKQLKSDFGKTTKHGKYTGASYLLLNSLPFLDLEDTITFTDPLAGMMGQTNNSKSILMSSLFREVSSTHFVPYHLMLKWGAMYHRYRKQIIDGVDILDGFLNSSNITQPITGSAFFDGGLIGSTFNSFLISGNSISHVTSDNVGLNPHYQAVYHQIVNGYSHYNINSGNVDYTTQTNSGNISHKVLEGNNGNRYWSVLVDNSKYKPTEQFYTLLPSHGLNQSDLATKNLETFDFAEQYTFRSWWFDESVTNEFSGKTFASHSEYPRNYISGSTVDNTFSIDTNYRKVIDLIATFSPEILDSFESMFLDFASEKTNDEIPYQVFDNLKYGKFQDLLKELVTVKKESSDGTSNTLFNLVKERQVAKATEVTSGLLSSQNIIKFTLANPKEIDPYTFYGMAKIENYNRYTVQPYSNSDLTPTNQKFIKLYIGEDMEGYYQEFFGVNDVKLTEENIIKYRPLAQIYAGYRKSGGTNSKSAFREYLRVSIFQVTGNKIYADGSDVRLKYFLRLVLSEISKKGNITRKDESIDIRKYQGHNLNDTKLELYNTFKSFNDKWTAGNSIGQRLLLEEFLFLDKANRDIGDKFFLNVDKILPLLHPNNMKQNLYGAISMLIQETGLDMRALPAYVNFYGSNFKNKTKIVPSKKVAKNLFGTFLEVDYQESSPKIIIQLVGASSKRADMSNSKANKFADDSFYVGSVNNNPLVITSLENFSKTDLSKSNKVVAFEVSFGDQNQGIFKGVQLDQSTLKNTSESFVVLENLGRSESGAGAYNVDVSLFDYYKSASYRCEVTCMGNVMIQPTMYFYLKNIPMFKGSYWITEVSHSIKSNNISTTFVGTRIPYTSLPDPKDSFISSYRVLFDKLSSKAQSKLKQAPVTGATTETSIVYDNASYSTDMKGKKGTNDEIITKTSPLVGVTEFGIPFNGYKNHKEVQKIDSDGTWLRAIAVKMGGEKCPIDPDTTMGIADGIKWSKLSGTTYKFYTTTFLTNVANSQKIRTATTNFKNPKNGKTFTLNPSYQLAETLGTIVANGPVGNGPIAEGYGMGMSPSLMSELGLFDGDVVYFKLT
jgi:hypothetical protein